MKSTIEDIYFGIRGHAETVKTSEDYWKVHKNVGEIYEKLLSTATDEQKKSLDELYIAMGGLEAEQSLGHFKEGFKLGMLLAIEAFCD